MATTTVSGVQYSGIWTMQQVNAAIAASTWPSQPANHLYVWGSGALGQLGLGNTTSYSSPKQLGSLTTWLKLSGGQDFSMATKIDGTLWSWGKNDKGQLGLGNTTYYSSPKQIGALTTWLSIACGRYHTLAIKTDGTLWSWGRSENYGQLGLGNKTNYSSPKQIGSLTTWAAISGGGETSMAIKTDGTLWTWGSNTNGQLGLGVWPTNYSSPMQVGSLTNWSKPAVGLLNSGAIKTNGTIWSWGLGTSGANGIGNTTDYSSPKQIGALTNWSSLQMGLRSTGSIKTDGTLWVWGYGAQGQLGQGNTTDQSSPVQVGSLTNWSQIQLFWTSMRSVKTDGTLWVWGSNYYGQLGLGNTAYKSSPTQVGALTTWINVASGQYNALAIAIT